MNNILKTYEETCNNGEVIEYSGINIDDDKSGVRKSKHILIHKSGMVEFVVIDLKEGLDNNICVPMEILNDICHTEWFKEE